VAERCNKCGVAEAVMCATCVNELCERCSSYVKMLQSDIARLQRLLQGQVIHLSDPADGSQVKDDG